MADIINTQIFDKSNQEEVLNQVAEDLIDIEMQIPAGGMHFSTYEKGKIENIGIITNFTDPIRVEKQGEFRPSAIGIDSKGSYVINAAVPYTEAVENTRFPCGDYTLTVGNQYNLNIGAGGGTISTLGNLKIGSNARTIITSKEELNISSAGNINVKSSTNISLESIGTFNLIAENQVVVDSNLGVSKNAIINGCAFIDGETYVNHITCPAEVQYTGGGIGSFAQLMPSGGATGNNMIGYADVSFIRKLLMTPVVDTKGGIHYYSWFLAPEYVPVFALPSDNIPLASSIGNNVGKNPEYSIFVYPHEHPFNNIPLTFTDGNGGLRDKATILNQGDLGLASNIENGYKSIGKTLS